MTEDKGRVEMAALLEINGLSVSYGTSDGRINVIEDVSFTVGHQEIIGLVGESGSGKSVTARAIMGMIKAPGKIDQGSILFNSQELVNLSQKEFQKLRCKEVSMIFQEPMTSLNPVYTVGEQLEETIITHLGYSKKQAGEYAVKMLEKVGISMPEARVKQYPFELSGGMRQRVMIAIALCCSPKLLIADEPTTALDVSIQAQILELMKALCIANDMSTIVVTHDMGVVAEMCERIVVMYAGKIVEISAAADLFREPLHPYTSALLKAIPRINDRPATLYTIPGSIPSPQEKPTGCRFNPRCDQCFDRCKQSEPPAFLLENGRQVSCWLFDPLKQTERV